MLVPAGIGGVVAVRDLDESDACLAEAAGHEALMPVVGGFGFPDAVEREGGGGFPGGIEHFGGVLLHAPGEFVGPEDAFEAGVVRAAERLFLIQGLEQFELPALFVRGATGVVEVSDGELVGGLAGHSDGQALMLGGQEGVAEVQHAAVSHGRSDGDEGGKVLAFRAQSVAQPGSHAGSDHVSRAAMQEEGGGTVCDAFGLHRANQTQAVHVSGNMGE